MTQRVRGRGATVRGMTKTARRRSDAPYWSAIGWRDGERSRPTSAGGGRSPALGGPAHQQEPQHALCGLDSHGGVGRLHLGRGLRIALAKTLGAKTQHVLECGPRGVDGPEQNHQRLH
ncbi:MAG: hypothetical protein ACK559_31455, partial [bacterium]